MYPPKKPQYPWEDGMGLPAPIGNAVSPPLQGIPNYIDPGGLGLPAPVSNTVSPPLRGYSPEEQDFLNRNPGDEHRMAEALGGARNYTNPSAPPGGGSGGNMNNPPPVGIPRGPNYFAPTAENPEQFWADDSAKQFGTGNQSYNWERGKQGQARFDQGIQRMIDSSDVKGTTRNDWSYGPGGFSYTPGAGKVTEMANQPMVGNFLGNQNAYTAPPPMRTNPNPAPVGGAGGNMPPGGDIIPGGTPPPNYTNPSQPPGPAQIMPGQPGYSNQQYTGSPGGQTQEGIDALKRYNDWKNNVPVTSAQGGYSSGDISNEWLNANKDSSAHAYNLWVARNAPGGSGNLQETESYYNPLIKSSKSWMERNGPIGDTISTPQPPPYTNPSMPGGLTKPSGPFIPGGNMSTPPMGGGLARPSGPFIPKAPMNPGGAGGNMNVPPLSGQLPRSGVFQPARKRVPNYVGM